MRIKPLPILLALALLAIPALSRAGELANIKVVTDANPDFSDMDSLVHSITANWNTDQEKMYALFYWLHVARRTTYQPMHLNSTEISDPIIQFNDFGYANYNSIAGMQCSIWNYMGYPCRLIGLTAEVWYDHQFHAYDNAYSCIFSLPDGKTIASVHDIDIPGSGPDTGGKKVRHYLAIYHALNGTSPNGYLQGGDYDRTLASHAENFAGAYPAAYYNQDRAHRYILNLRDGEAYTRYYSRQDEHTPHDVVWKPVVSEYKSDTAYFVPNGLDELGNPSDPEALIPNYHLRANGERPFTPILDQTHLSSSLFSSSNLQCISGTGVPPVSGNASVPPALGGGALQPLAPHIPAVAIFKIEGANILTSTKIRALFNLASPSDSASIALSTTNGLQWKTIWQSEKTDLGQIDREFRLIDDVSGHYSFLLKVTLTAAAQPQNAQLQFISFNSLTEINSKTQPQLHIGKNTVYVGVGDQSQSIVLDPDLHAHKYAPFLFEEKNIRTNPNDTPYQALGQLLPDKPAEEAHLTFKIDAPTDITALTYGGRLSNRNPQSHIDFLHSFDNGKTWIKDGAYANTPLRSDDVHYETLRDIPPGNRSVLLKYSLTAAPNDANSCSLYSLHMEIDHRIPAPAKSPLAVTFRWREQQQDYSYIPRSHTQIIDKFPTTYTIDVAGADHPIVDSLTLALADTDIRAATVRERSPDGNLRDATVRERSPDGNIRAATVRERSPGYSDGHDPGGEKWVGNWATYGNNLAFHKPYTLSLPSEDWWGSGDPNLQKLTDGIVGSSFSGGNRFGPSAAWSGNKNPEITLDLGESKKCAAFRIQTVGWEPWDAVKGENQDHIEVLTSTDAKTWTSAGVFNTKLRWKDIPVNFMYPDDETLGGYNFTLPLAAPVDARYVKYKIQTTRILGVTEIQVLDSYTLTPFDLKIALPNPSQNGKPSPKPDLSPTPKSWPPNELPTPKENPPPTITPTKILLAVALGRHYPERLVPRPKASNFSSRGHSDVWRSQTSAAPGTHNAKTAGAL